MQGWHRSPVPRRLHLDPARVQLDRQHLHRAPVPRHHRLRELLADLAYGEDWQTDPLDADAWCEDVIVALESLPNNVIPANSVQCLDNSMQPVGAGNSFLHIGDGTPTSPHSYDVHRTFILSFPANPGRLRQMEVNIHLDGPRPSLTTTEPSTEPSTAPTLQTVVYADGFSGEALDQVPDLCRDVTLSLAFDSTNGFYLSGMDYREVSRLQRCLGDADGDGVYPAGQTPSQSSNW